MSNEIQLKQEELVKFANEWGVLLPQQLNLLKQRAEILIKARVLPSYYDSPEKVIIGMQYAKSLGVSPETSLDKIYIVNNKPAIMGVLAKRLILSSGADIQYWDEYYEDYDGQRLTTAREINEALSAEALVAVCEVERKPFARRKFTFSVADAKRASLWGKRGKYGPTPWITYPTRMLAWRAFSQANDALFQDILSGGTVYESMDIEEAEVVEVNGMGVSNKSEVEDTAKVLEVVEAKVKPIKKPEKQIKPEIKKPEVKPDKEPVNKVEEKSIEKKEVKNDLEDLFGETTEPKQREQREKSAPPAEYKMPPELTPPPDDEQAVYETKVIPVDYSKIIEKVKQIGDPDVPDANGRMVRSFINSKKLESLLRNLDIENVRRLCVNGTVEEILKLIPSGD